MQRIFREFRDLLQSVPPLIVTFFVLSVVGMNLLANKSIETGVDWLALDCGILFSWLAFLSMDVITHVYGPRAATLVSFAALGMDLLTALVFFLASLVPGVWGESFVEGSEELLNHALDRTFGGTWFVVLGSAAAFIVSAVANNFINAGVGKLLGKREGFGRFALRAYVSTFLAQFLDNLVFAFLVSRTFFGWSAVQCLTCALTGAFTELLFEVVFSPFGYRVSKRIERTREASRAGEGGNV